jgi:hypothetical protein
MRLTALTEYSLRQLMSIALRPGQKLAFKALTHEQAV